MSSRAGGWFRRGVRSRVLKLRPHSLRASAKVVFDPDSILIDWVHRGPVKENWGDAVAPILVRSLSGRTVVNRRDVLGVAIQRSQKPVHTTIGSMLGGISGSNVVVWGSGFVDSSQTLRVKPTRIHAVRGPLTRERIQSSGIQCPEVFGDPALLFPMLYRPGRTDQYALGIIPHYKERGLPQVVALSKSPGVKIIDICGGITRVADEINQCARIASGSLHGLVLGDAYGIPSIWIKLSDLPYGDGFKFRDYLASVGRGSEQPVAVNTGASVHHIMDSFGPYDLRIDIDQLLRTCPFYDPRVFNPQGLLL